MSVSAQSKGPYWQRGLWEMTPDVLLLILALTACLTESVHCEEADGSGAQAQSTEEWILTIAHTTAVTSVTLNSTITVHIQEEQDFGDAEKQAQVTLEQNSPTTTRIPDVTRIKTLNTTREGKHKSLHKSSVDDTTVASPEQNNTSPEDAEEEEKDLQTVFVIIAVCLILVLVLAAIVAGLLIARRRRKQNTTDPEKDDPYLDDEDGEKVPMPMFEDDMPSVMELEMEDFEKWMIKEGSDNRTDSKQRHPS
ncbi:transmembrane protein 154 isoform X2 [Ictalurus furcatus]|uniref:transmembrane protein 154 isoform X2 n=1 Tax=Ictalurus furcatus TaxID=66913 RepID=UPI00234FBF69|nr:transmembrane protein 154 isoform X2 [Ictalurus furcatus]